MLVLCISSDTQLGGGSSNKITSSQIERRVPNSAKMEHDAFGSPG